MTLTAGTKLGSYEVVAPLGAGGMGEVYRARDSRLDRTAVCQRTSRLLEMSGNRDLSVLLSIISKDQNRTRCWL
jgi:serine/threonine protein kinase